MIKKERESDVKTGEETFACCFVCVHFESEIRMKH